MGKGIGKVMWVAGDGEGESITTAALEVEEIIGMVAVLGIGTGILIAGNDDEDTNTFSEVDDDGKVNEGMCRGILKIGVSSAVKWNMGVWNEGCIIGADVEVAVW